MKNQEPYNNEVDGQLSKQKKTINKWGFLFILILISPIFIYIFFLLTHNKTDDCLSKNSLSALKLAIAMNFPALQDNFIEINESDIAGRNNLSLDGDTYACKAYIKKDKNQAFITYDYNFKKRTVTNIAPVIPTCKDNNNEELMLNQADSFVLNVLNASPDLKLISKGFSGDIQTESNSKKSTFCKTGIVLGFSDHLGNTKFLTIPEFYGYDLSYGLFPKFYYNLNSDGISEQNNVNTISKPSQATKLQKYDYFKEQHEYEANAQKSREKEIKRIKNDLLAPSKDKVQQAESDLF